MCMETMLAALSVVNDSWILKLQISRQLPQFLQATFSSLLVQL